MYWNLIIFLSLPCDYKININMRCIEIMLILCFRKRLHWLTLTWDVLKFIVNDILMSIIMININMRCIEIQHAGWSSLSALKININMRCIEIISSPHSAWMVVRLTLTWDVLKSIYRIVGKSKRKININMRCIEMPSIFF